jgi:TonB family protein
MKGKPAEFPLQRGAVQQARPQMSTAVPAALGAAAGSTSAGTATLTSARVIAGFAEQSQRASQAAVPSAGSTASPTAVPAAGPRRHPHIVWTTAILMCLGLGGCFGYALARWLAARPVPAGASISTPAARHPIALEATWNGNSLHLQWDRNAPAIRGASSGVLWISDGSQQRRLELGGKELTQGSIQYWPASADVNFTLDAVSAGGTASESVRALAVPVQKLDPLRPAERSGSRDRAQPTARVDIEVPPQSLVGRATGRPVPTVPAKPLRTVMPTVSSELAGRIQDPITVSVRVDINASGTVRRAELVSKRSEITRPFDNLALNASRRWTFTPAGYGQRRVQSRLILHYHFGNPVALLSESR